MRPVNEGQIIIRDSGDQKNILIQVDVKNDTTMVLSNFSAWENLTYVLERVWYNSATVYSGWKKQE
jgi:hypothetical protein